MINIRACVSDMNDIFDGARANEKVGPTQGERRAFVEPLEQLCCELQGSPFRKHLKPRRDDADAERTLKAYMDQFIDASPVPESLRAAGRIRRRLAVMYASAAQAIDYEVLPWGKRATLKEIKACLYDALS